MEIRLGVWIWGTITALAGIGVLIVIVMASVYIDAMGSFDTRTPKWLPKVYRVLRDLGALIGTAVGFSALAWAQFFQKLTK
jgi:hypothetical protein